MSRKDNTLLPDNTELDKILATEVRRKIPTDKINVHYPVFDAVVELFKAYDLPVDIFYDDHQTIHEVVHQGGKLLAMAVPKLLSAATESSDTTLFNAVYDYLAEEDNPEPSDIIFIFGSKTPLRAQKAAEIYRHSLGNRIVVSGGGPIYTEASTKTEAGSYRILLEEAGIDPGVIITEDKAITVPDNVWRSLNLLDDLNISYKSIILVNSPYSQRRGWSIFKKHLPDSISLYRVNSDTADKFKRNNWYKQEETMRVILNEYIKMRASVVYNSA